jgi:hypothetical protein
MIIYSASTTAFIAIAVSMACSNAAWIEDSIRDKERAKSFDDEFIALARSDYVTNDLRASLKRPINLCMDSNLVEEKSNQAY